MKACAFYRHEFATQVAQLASELGVLQSSVQRLQDLVQLPCIHIWNQQQRHVMSQSLAQDLAALTPSFKLLPRQATSTVLPKQASNAAGPDQASSIPKPDQAGVPSRPGQTDSVLSDHAGAMSETGQSLARDQDAASMSEPSQPSSDAMQRAPTHAAFPNQDAPQQSLPDQAASSAISQSGVTIQSRLPQRARPGASQQATARHLPNQASSSQGSFLSGCLSELLRLSDPYSSQYQPLLCGWYDAKGEQIIGLG